MASITIRDLDPELKSRLRVRAAQHGRSMEEEVRVILRAAMAERAAGESGLGTAISRRFKSLGGVDLQIPAREPMPAATEAAMIVLDTNVISEFMRRTPAAAVVRWVDSRPIGRLYTTAVTQAEILHGIMLLPRSKRRDTLAVAATQIFEGDFVGRVLPFAGDAATAYAEIASSRRRGGRPISAFDAQIAAIVRSTGAQLATRNVDDFEGCGIDVVDPWEP